MMLAPIAARAAYLDAELRRLATNAATLNAEDLRFELRRVAELADHTARELIAVIEAQRAPTAREIEGRSLPSNVVPIREPPKHRFPWIEGTLWLEPPV